MGEKTLPPILVWSNFGKQPEKSHLLIWRIVRKNLAFRFVHTILCCRNNDGEELFCASRISRSRSTIYPIRRTVQKNDT